MEKKETEWYNYTNGYGACSEHGGETDIHGKLLKVVKPGYQVHEKISVVKIICTMILIFITVIIFIILKKKVISKWL